MAFVEGLQDSGEYNSLRWEHLRQTSRSCRTSRSSASHRLHTGSWEETFMSICESSEPPALVLLEQYLDQVTLLQVQLLGPAGPVRHHNHRLLGTVLGREPKLVPAEQKSPWLRESLINHCVLQSALNSYCSECWKYRGRRSHWCNTD